jgi:hypothetical protein
MTYYEYWLRSKVDINLLFELKSNTIKPLANDKFKLKLFFKLLLSSKMLII